MTDTDRPAVTDLTTPTDMELVPATMPADRNPALVYLARLGSGSRRTMRGALDKLADLLSLGRCDAVTFPWPALRYQHAQAARSALVAEMAPSSVNKHLAALRGVLREAWRLGLLDAESYQRAADVQGVRGRREPAGRMLRAAEFQKLFEECAKGGAAGARDAALLAVLAGAGLRRAEAAALDLADYDPATGALRVRHGKGGKDRTVYLENGSRTALGAWLKVRGPDAGALLCPVSQVGQVELRRMTGQAVLYILRRLASDASVAAFTPHDLRRSFISHLIDAGADLVSVKGLAGHANVNTTAAYDRRGEEAKRRAARLVHLPYVPQVAA